eukprot:14010137-Alexandrium_andersonii.AAC.1
MAHGPALQLQRRLLRLQLPLVDHHPHSTVEVGYTRGITEGCPAVGNAKLRRMGRLQLRWRGWRRWQRVAIAANAGGGKGG